MAEAPVKLDDEAMILLRSIDRTLTQISEAVSNVIYRGDGPVRVHVDNAAELRR